MENYEITNPEQFPQEDSALRRRTRHGLSAEETNNPAEYAETLETPRF